MIVQFIWSQVEVFVTSGEEHEWTLWSQKASKMIHNLLCFFVRRILGFYQILLWAKEIRVLAAEAGGRPVSYSGSSVYTGARVSHQGEQKL